MKKGDDDEEDHLSSVDTPDESRPFPITSNDEVWKKNAAPSSEKAKVSMKSDDDDEEEEDGELRERIEEFIEKINRGWRDEKLKNSSTKCRMIQGAVCFFSTNEGTLFQWDGLQGS